MLSVSINRDRKKKEKRLGIQEHSSMNLPFFFDILHFD